MNLADFIERRLEEWENSPEAKKVKENRKSEMDDRNKLNVSSNSQGSLHGKENVNSS